MGRCQIMSAEHCQIKLVGGFLKKIGNCPRKWLAKRKAFNNFWLQKSELPRKLSEARKRKNRRLKQAKEEAQAEIEKYKSERDNQFKEYETRYAGSKGDVAARIDQDAKARIEAMNSSVTANKGKVMSGLIDAVCNIEPKVHDNYRA